MVRTMSNLNLEKILIDLSEASENFNEFMMPISRKFARLGKLNIKKGSFYDFPDEISEEEQLGTLPNQRILFLLPDTHLYKTNIPALLENQSIKNNRDLKKPKIEISMLPIVAEELEENGLARHDVIPAELYRGEKSLLSKCGPLPEEMDYEVKSFYDVATSHFEFLISELFKFQDRNSESSSGEIAQQFISKNNLRLENGLHQSYHSMFTKLMNKRKKGNEFNYIADKVLGLFNFGMNFFSSNKLSVILTGDGDFKAIEHFIFDSVLPEFIAKKAKETVEEYAPGRWTRLGITKNGLNSLKSWARKQIRAGLEIEKLDERRPTNIVYNCRTGEIYVSYVHPMIRQFAYDKSVGLAKSYVAERCTLDRISPSRLIKRLQENSIKYKDWLNELSRN